MSPSSPATTVRSKVDNHNKRCQHELGLEEVWVTNDAYFRIFTSLIGITAVDTHIALCAVADAYSKILNFSTEQYADLLAGEMLLRDLWGGCGQKRKEALFDTHVNTREELEAASRTFATPAAPSCMWGKRRKSA
jgi:hypothetical protein